MFEEIHFSGEGYDKIWIPRTSTTQIGVFNELRRLCFGEDRFDGPMQEVGLSRSSLNIGFMSIIGNQKIGYEVDGPTHVESEAYDRKRDYYLLKQRGWQIYRINYKYVDQYGYTYIAKTILYHLLYELGLTEYKLWNPEIITSFTIIH